MLKQTVLRVSDATLAPISFGFSSSQALPWNIPDDDGRNIATSGSEIWLNVRRMFKKVGPLRPHYNTWQALPNTADSELRPPGTFSIVVVCIRLVPCSSKIWRSWQWQNVILLYSSRDVRELPAVVGALGSTSDLFSLFPVLHSRNSTFVNP